jgi:NADH-quinone oxidoreductase subunit M
MGVLTLLSLNVFSLLGLLVLDSSSKKKLRQFGLWMSLLLFVVGILLYGKCVESLEAGVPFWLEEKNVIWFDLFGFDFQLGFDFLSYYLLWLTLFLIPVSILCSWESIQKKWKEFLICLFLMEFFLILVFLVMDLFLFYCFFEGVLIPMFLIIGIWGSRERKIHAAYQFFLYTLFGSLLMLLGIIYIYLEKGTGNLLILYETSFTGKEQFYLWIVFFFSFAVKTPMVPVHLWLPEAHVEAPTAGSVLLAGILLKLGGYGMIRFLLPLFPAATLYFQPFVYLLAIVGIWYSSLTTIRQIDLKKIIAYSSVGHMNYVVLGLFSDSLEGMLGAYYMMISHGFVSSGLFLCIGMLYDRYHSRNLFDYGGLVQLMPLYTVFLFVLIFANFGFPGTSSFIGEFLILLGVSLSNRIIFFLAGFGLLLSTVYNLWFLNRLVFGPLTKKVETHVDLNKREFSLIFLFVSLTLFFGLFPSKLLETISWNLNGLIWLMHESIS